MSSVVRTTTGMTMMASATAPAQAGEMPHLRDHDLVDEQADDDRGRAQENVVDEADHHGELGVAAVLGHVGAGQHAERRAEQHREHGEDQAADDRVEQAAGAARRRRHLGEHRERQSAHALHHENKQDEHEPGQAEDRGPDRQRRRQAVAASAGGDSGKSLPRLPSSLPRFPRDPHQHEPGAGEHDEGDEEQDKAERDRATRYRDRQSPR